MKLRQTSPSVGPTFRPLPTHQKSGHFAFRSSNRRYFPISPSCRPSFLPIPPRSRLSASRATRFSTGEGDSCLRLHIDYPSPPPSPSHPLSLSVFQSIYLPSIFRVLRFFSSSRGSVGGSPSASRLVDLSLGFPPPSAATLPGTRFWRGAFEVGERQGARSLLSFFVV